MKNKMMRLLSMMLALVLAVGLMQAGVVEAEAAETMTFLTAMDCQRTKAYPSKGDTVNVYSFKNPLLGNATSSTDRFTSQDGTWTLVPLGKYDSATMDSGYLPDVVNGVAGQYHVTAASIDVYQLKRDGADVVKGVVIAQSSDTVLFIGGNWNKSDGGYLLVNRVLTDEEKKNGFDIQIQKDVTDDATPVHTHTWKIDTTGNGTKEAKAAIRCTGADCNLNGQYMEVKLTAEDVTLPGNAFPITVTVDYGIGRNNDFAGFTISQKPGFKYSADGTGYVDIDPATFVAKQGHYQASIMIMENNDPVENLYVKYTVSDPVVTASTGDERPIEMMLVGLAAFSAMAAMAFIMDSKRRMVR